MDIQQSTIGSTPSSQIRQTDYGGDFSISLTLMNQIEGNDSHEVFFGISFSCHFPILNGKMITGHDNKGYVLMPDQPLTVCDEAATALAALDRNDIFISESTFFYDEGGGCC